MNRLRKIISMFLVICIVLPLSACSNGDKASKIEKKEGPKIVVGSKEFTENILLGKMLIKVLEDNGYDVQDETGLGASGLIRTALTSGEIDAYWEYTGTTLIHNMEEQPLYDSEETYNKVKEWDEKNNDLIWLDYSQINNTYCIVTRDDISKDLGINTISDMAECINNGEDLKFISNPEYFERPDGMKQVENTYGFELPEKNRVLLDLGLFFDALLNNEGDLTVGFTTDANIIKENLKVLEDDKTAFPVYNATPVFRKEIIDAYPELPGLVNKLSSLLDNKTILELNSEVDVKERDIDEVAEEFLQENNLIE